MSTITAAPATTPIPVQLSEPEFEAFILPHLSMPKRGPKCKLGYYRVFNLILWLLYTGMQWKCLPVPTNPDGKPTIHYFDCLRQILRTVVYVSSVEAVGYVASSDRSVQAHCAASASGMCPADAPSCRTDRPRARSPRCLGESGVTSSLASFFSRVANLTREQYNRLPFASLR